MNLDIARTLTHEAMALAEQVAIYEARYGRGTRLRPGSPADAWSLHDTIRDTLNRIACLLDPAALEVKQFKFGRWWERQDVMDTATAAEIVTQTTQLLTCMVYNVEQSHTEWSHASHSIQRVIAGLLPHTARMVAADEVQATARLGTA